MVNAKALLKDALKAAKGKTMERNALETSVVAALVAGGKSEKKAKKIVAEKLELPIFTSKGTSIVLVSKKDAEVAPALLPEERKAAAEEEPPRKKKKKDKELAPPQSIMNHGLSMNEPMGSRGGGDGERLPPGDAATGAMASGTMPPLSPSKRGNGDDVVPGNGDKRARKETGKAPMPVPAVVHAPRGVAAISEVNTGWQLQLKVRCEQAYEKEAKVKHDYCDEAYACRTLVMSGNASAFDLLKAILCSFGLISTEYNHANGMGSLGGLGTIILQDVLATQHGTKDVRAVGPIAGLSRSAIKHHEGSLLRSEVNSADLKKVKLAQLLDKPWYDTPTRSSRDGLRSRVWMLLDVPERVGFVSGVRGGVVEAVKPHLYAFAVLCEAIGTKSDMLSSFQRYLPRCVEAMGGLVGGNEIGWEFGDETDGANPGPTQASHSARTSSIAFIALFSLTALHCVCCRSRLHGA